DDGEVRAGEGYRVGQLRRGAVDEGQGDGRARRHEVHPQRPKGPVSLLFKPLLLVVDVVSLCVSQINENVAREIINQRSLCHPNIIRFKEVVVVQLQVVLTPTHLAIVMEYAAGGELFERICHAGRFSEDEVPFSLLRCFFFGLKFLLSSAISHQSLSLTFQRSLLQARYFFQQLISGVSYCHYMVYSLQTPIFIPNC
ncbi:hypothetical protein BHE74_00004764, partial [Ensete ventricosum]